MKPEAPVEAEEDARSDKKHVGLACGVGGGNGRTL